MPWWTIEDVTREQSARLLGAKPLEVCCMNSLTVNLHLLLAAFYRPTATRFKIVLEDGAFPSDEYALQSQASSSSSRSALLRGGGGARATVPCAAVTAHSL